MLFHRHSMFPLYAAATIGWTGALWIFFFYCSTKVERVVAQVRILQPQTAATQFSPDGVIKATTLPFGLPYWGEVIVGFLHYHAPEKDPQLCIEGPIDRETWIPPVLSDATEANETESWTQRILIADAGGCSFTTKARIAQSKGASALLVVSKASNLDETVDHHLGGWGAALANDDSAHLVQIPTLRIAQEDGKRLIDLVVAQPHDPVTLQLYWGHPTEETVTVQFLMSPGLVESGKFLADFAPFARALKHRMQWIPKLYVFEFYGNSSMCWRRESGTFCTFPADWDGVSVSGKSVLQEAIRELCLWDMTKNAPTNANDNTPQIAQSTVENGPSMTSQEHLFSSRMEYSETWWNYAERFAHECLSKKKENSGVEIVEPQLLSGEDSLLQCSYNVMKELDVNVTAIARCVETHADSYLIKNLHARVEDMLTLVIQHAKLYGPLSAQAAASTVCATFAKNAIPDTCRDLRTQEGALESSRETLSRRVGLSSQAGPLSPKSWDDVAHTLNSLTLHTIGRVVGLTLLISCVIFAVAGYLAYQKGRNQKCRRTVHSSFWNPFKGTFCHRRPEQPRNQSYAAGEGCQSASVPVSKVTPC